MEKMTRIPTPKEIFREFAGYKNPPVTKDIDIVWVISGHDAFDGSAATSAYSIDYLGDTYRGEDRQRVQKGIALVRQVTAIRLNKNPSWGKIHVDFFAADEIQKNPKQMLKTVQEKAKKIEAYAQKGDLSQEPEQNS